MTVMLPPAAIRRAADLIRRGDVVAIPTDTLYGLAADAFQPKAVRKVFQLKGRPENKPILLLVESKRQAESLAARLPAAFDRIADRFWPGPVTMVLPSAPGVPAAITAGTGTVAVRVPGRILTRALIRAVRSPLTGTSANRSGRPAAESPAQVLQQFRGGLLWLLNGGPAPSRIPSTIVDLTAEPRVIREGAVPAEAILCLC